MILFSKVHLLSSFVKKNKVKSEFLIIVHTLIRPCILENQSEINNRACTIIKDSRVSLRVWVSTNDWCHFWSWEPFVHWDPAKEFSSASIDHSRLFCHFKHDAGIRNAQFFAQIQKLSPTCQLRQKVSNFFAKENWKK